MARSSNHVYDHLSSCTLVSIKLLIRLSSPIVRRRSCLGRFEELPCTDGTTPVIISSVGSLSDLSQWADTPNRSFKLMSPCLASPIAARSGNVPVVKKLLEKGCDVNHGNLFYTTPLHLACQNDHLEMVK